MTARRGRRAPSRSGRRGAGDAADAPRAVQSLGNGAFRLPDGSIAYTMERAAIECKKVKPVEYTATDVILLLLSSRDGPIVGRALLFQGLFLFARGALAGESVEDCEFVPYYRRPHSFYLATKIREMARLGLIEISKRGRVPAYALTRKGLKKARARRRTVPAGLAAGMGRLRDGMGRNGFARTLAATGCGDEYAAYAKKTRMAHLYRAITWGRGI